MFLFFTQDFSCGENDGIEASEGIVVVSESGDGLPKLVISVGLVGELPPSARG